MEVEVQGDIVVDTPTTEEVVQEEVVTLPSDNPEFEVPEKFKDKSIEDVIKSYQELEKMKGGGKESQEEKPTEGEETSKNTEEQYQKYADSLDKNGTLTEAEYTELAEAGYDKTTVDTEIKRRADLKEFEAYKAEKALNDVLAPLGGGAEKFKEVSDWANTNKTPEEVKTFNETLASVPKLAQQAMLKGLYAEYASAGEEGGTVLHTNTTQSTPSRGYSSEADFFKDISSPEYQTHKSFAAAVEKKLGKSNTEGWSIG